MCGSRCRLGWMKCWQERKYVFKQQFQMGGTINILKYILFHIQITAFSLEVLYISFRGSLVVGLELIVKSLPSPDPFFPSISKVLRTSYADQCNNLW